MSEGFVDVHEGTNTTPERTPRPARRRDFSASRVRATAASAQLLGHQRKAVAQHLRAHCLERRRLLATERWIVSADPVDEDSRHVENARSIYSASAPIIDVCAQRRLQACRSTMTDEGLVQLRDEFTRERLTRSSLGEHAHASGRKECAGSDEFAQSVKILIWQLGSSSGVELSRRLWAAMRSTIRGAA
jgi:hypothetical protein